MARTYTAEDAILAIRGSRGIISAIANRMGCSRNTVYNLINKYKTVATALEEERESLKDFAEAKLAEQINAGNMTAIIFYLKTQAKDRGYIERQEVDSSGELNIRVTFEDELD